MEKKDAGLTGITKDGKELTFDQVLQKIHPRLEELDRLSNLEYYAVFMGKTQVVEWLLKRLLTDERGYEYSALEKKTLGATIDLLSKEGLRRDYLSLLKDLNKYRVYYAHDYLADHFIFEKILKGQSLTGPTRELGKAHFAIEQVLVVHEWVSENGSFWTQRAETQTEGV